MAGDGDPGVWWQGLVKGSVGEWDVWAGVTQKSRESTPGCT